MYSNLAFAISLLGLFSIFELLKGSQKISLIKYHFIARLFFLTLGSFFDYLELAGYEIPYYHQIFKLITAVLFVNMLFLIVLKKLPKLVIGIEIFFTLYFIIEFANGFHLPSIKDGVLQNKPSLYQIILIGTYIFFTLSAAIDTKLASKDTSFILSPYSRISYVDSALSTKLLIIDTIKYTKQIYTDAALRTKFNISDTIKYTKLIYTDSALLTKMHLFDTSRFAKQIFIDSALSTKLKITDTIKYTKLTYTDSALSTKLLLTDTIKYTKQIYTDSALLTKLYLTGNALTATIANNITATTNTTLTSLSNLNTVGTITTGVWSATTIDIAHGGTGLNTPGLDGQVLSTAADGSLQWVSLTSSTTTHRIGERFGGGIVFFVYDNGKHGLIAATSDQASYVRWGTTTAVNAVRDGINAGMANTERIILVQGSAGDYAAQIAANYKGGGFGDWYLPSKYELNLLFQKKIFVGIFPGFGYWSSNESGNSNAWGQDFNDIWGTQFYTNRTQKHSCVRAIRSF